MSILPKTSRASLRVLTILILISFFLRAPFFFRDYIDKDESTFIIMGQNWVDGHLPFTFLWDLKPLFLFGFFALLLKLFGKSLILIRATGMLVVGLTVYIFYTQSKSFRSKNQSLFAAILCCYFLSLFGAVKGVMSEHLAVFSLLLGWFFYHEKRYYVLAGFILFSALLFKSNYVYAFFLFALTELYFAIKHKSFSPLYKSFLGLLIPIGICIFPYWQSDNLNTLYSAMILAPLAYADVDIMTQIKTLLYILPVASIYLFIILKNKYKLNRRNIGLLALNIGVLFSFIKLGKINDHYLLQWYPLFFLFLVQSQLKWPQFKTKKSIRAALLFFLILPVESYKEYKALWAHQKQNDSWYNGEGVAVPNYLKEQKLDQESVFYLDFHIGYWFQNQNPPTMVATHPSNIAREELYPFIPSIRSNPSEEIKHLFEVVRPRIVVKSKNKILGKNFDRENRQIQNYLNRLYRPIHQIDKAVILQRLELE
ncbi:MAG: ArnT family glycosyltransferase [Flavobacteriaceae bacterium]